MKLFKKKLIIVLTILIFIIILNVGNSFAFSVTDLTGTQVSDQNLQGIGNSIITILTTVGSILSVIVLILLGLKYMLGSVEEKAEYKRSLMPYLIGATLVFTASVIAGVIYRFAINMG